MAENSSRSLVEIALARILEDPSFGTSGESVTLDESGQNNLSFNDQQSLLSHNNLEGEGSIAGWQGRVVPPQTVHLVGRATEGNATRTTEALYAIPPYPYAISGSPTVTSVGSLVVGGVASLDAAYESLEKEDLLPADLASNSNTSAAVSLGPDTFVSGNVEAVGGIAPGGAEVRGEVLSQSDRVALPQISLDRYDPSRNPGALEIGSGSSPRSIEGMVRHNGDFTMTGPLELDNGVLYVDGDFTLRLDHLSEGGLRGYGALIVRGETTIEGASKFAHLNGIALLSEGDIEIIGTSQEQSFFQGLLYSEGSVRAENITVLGGLVSNSNDSDAEIVLKDSRAIHVPELTQIDVGNPPTWTFQIVEPPNPNTNPGPGGDPHNDPGPPEIALRSLSADYSIAYDPESKRVRLIGAGKATIEVTAALVLPTTGDGGEDGGGSDEVSYAEADARFGGLSSEIFDVPQQMGNGTSMPQVVTPTINKGSTLLSMEGLVMDFEIDLETLRANPQALEGLSVTGPFPQENSTGGTPGPNEPKSYDLHQTGITLNAAQAEALRDKILEQVNPGRPTTVYNFDPNQFLALADKIRLQFLRTE